MMQPDLQTLLSAVPNTVDWDNIVEFDRLDERVSAVGDLFANIIGVNEGFVEWCPNEEPPSQQETLAWLWVIRPDLGTQIASQADSDLRQAIDRYNAG